MICHKQGFFNQSWLELHSLGKSLFANLLGLAIERCLVSLDDPIQHHLPSLVEHADHEPLFGSKTKGLGRSSLKATLGQLASHSCGLFHQKRDPGDEFDYGTANYCALLHSLSSAWDSRDDELGLVNRLLLRPVGARARGENDSHHLMPGHLAPYLDDFLRLEMKLDGLLRVAWLWRCQGRWGESEVIPHNWMRLSTQVAPELHHLPAKDQVYGYGFWTNAADQLWPGLPRDLCLAQGYGGIRAFFCPSADLAGVSIEPPRFERFEDQVRDDRVLRAVFDCLDF